MEIGFVGYVLIGTFFSLLSLGCLAVFCHCILMVFSQAYRDFNDQNFDELGE